MPRFFIAFLDRSVRVEAPASLAGDLAAFFQLCAGATTDTPDRTAIITEEAAGRYALALGAEALGTALTRGEVLQRLAADIGRDTFLDDETHVALKAAAVGWGEKAVLIVGSDGAGKSALAAWFIEKGFGYRADDSVVLPAEPGTIAGLPGPLSLKADALGHIAALTAFHAAPSVRADKRLLVCPERTWLAADTIAPCGLLIDVNFEAGAELRIEPLPADQATLGLLVQTRKVVIPSDPQYAPIAALAEKSPALRLTYGSYAQIDGVLDFLVRVALEMDVAPGEFEAFTRGLPRPTPPRKIYPVPARSERRFSPKLTIGMATYDDFDGVYFSIQAIRMYHPEIVDHVEFVVVDNHPDGPCSEALKKLENSIPNYRYIPMDEATGTSRSRDRVFSEAGGTFVLCMDCHVFIVPGALRRLLDYFDRYPDSADLLQGPILYDDLKTISTNYEPTWLAGFLGVWGNDPAGADPNGPPFEIAMQGLGLFACRRAAWLGFHPHFRGFGGEEGYIHEKFRRVGHRTLCLPFLRWMHRFQRPMGVPFPNIWIDRIRNYLVGFREFGLPTDEMHDHFREVVGADHADELFAMMNEALKISPLPDGPDMDKAESSACQHPP